MHAYEASVWMAWRLPLINQFNFDGDVALFCSEFNRSCNKCIIISIRS